MDCRRNAKSVRSTPPLLTAIQTKTALPTRQKRNAGRPGGLEPAGKDRVRTARGRPGRRRTRPLRASSPGSSRPPASARHRCGGLAEELDRVGEDLDAVLGDTVGAGPARVVQATLDRDLRALADVLGDVGAEAVEAGDAVPLGLLLDLAGVLVGPLGRGGDRERGDVAAGLGVAADRVGAGVADDDDEVGHGGSPELRRGIVPSTGSVKSRAAAVRHRARRREGNPDFRGGAGSLSPGPATAESRRGRATRP